MKDKLEDFVRSHNTEFDLNEPDQDLWKGIEKRISKKKHLSWHYYMSRAAVVTVIFGASLLVQRIWIGREGKVAETKEAEINIPELREAEMYYLGMINAKLEEVKPFLSKYPSLEEELNTDLSELDSICNGLKKDLKDNIANHEVIEAMIQNYRLRITMLEDMLMFLEEDSQEEETNNIERI
ncbi:MAG: hypothetical protein JW894_14145 [Bacteroidales bacterium]|nr:hypothetical protein [Bacteroidales bacterium]